MTVVFLRRLALLSISAAVVTIGMKSMAYFLTGSAGLLSDALESGVNLLAAGTAYVSLWYASRPADATHAFGHEKIEFFAAGLEGILILIAGVGTIWYSIERLWTPQPIQAIGLGSLIALLATVINFLVAQILLRNARIHHSIVLEADGQHLMTDVYTSAAVVAGLGLVALTGWQRFDPLLALLVGLNISRIGFCLIRRSYEGLMDHALPPGQIAELREQIRQALPAGTDFHALRTRQAGSRTFAEFHMLVPGLMSVREAHELTHRVEDQIKSQRPTLMVTVHIEPIDEPTSWEEAELTQLGEPSSPVLESNESHGNR